MASPPAAGAASAASSAVRLVTAAAAAAGPVLHLRLRVKPSASPARHGAARVLADHVELCVAARPRHGDANLAVVGLVGRLTGLPPARVRLLARGRRSRDKTVELAAGDAARDGQEFAAAVLDSLRRHAAAGS